MQLLSVLWHALEEDELQKHFNYVFMHTRCAALLKDLRSSFIAGCPTNQSASGEDLEMFKQLELHVKPIEFLQQFVMPADAARLAYICIAHAVFASDPAASVAVQVFNIEDRPCLKPKLRGNQWTKKSAEAFVRVRVGGICFMQDCCGVSLEKVAKVIKECIDRERATEVELGSSLCALHARTSLVTAGTTSNAATTN